MDVAVNLVVGDVAAVVVHVVQVVVVVVHLMFHFALCYVVLCHVVLETMRSVVEVCYYVVVLKLS